MKRKILLGLGLLVCLMACGQVENSPSSKDQESQNQEKIFSRIKEEGDLRSYCLETKTQGDSYEMISQIEAMKEPNISHIQWESQEGDKIEKGEEFRLDDSIFHKKTDGSWEKRPPMKGSQFKAKTELNTKTLLRPLERFYQVKEEGDAYILTLASGDENIQEIKTILQGKESFDELMSLKVTFSFDKKTGFPLSYDWKAQVHNKESKEERTIRQKGQYSRVNELEGLELPDEIKEEIIKE